MRYRIDVIAILKGRREWFKLAIYAIFIVLAAFGIRHLGKDPNIVLLASDRGTQWIRYPLPFELNAWLPETRTATFKYRFHIDAVPPQAVLTLRVLKQATLYLNARPLAVAPSDPQRWKEPNQLDLCPGLVKGDNELSVEVVNENGPPALLAYCDDLGIMSGQGWESSEDGQPWLAAIPVDDIPPFPASRTFPRTDQAFRSLLLLFVPLFILIFFWSLLLDERPGWTAKASLSAGTVRWLLLGGWLVMGINNFGKIPISFGMDYPGHAQYISYVATYWRVPLATEGWQMFQPPLFYYLEAVVFRLFLHVFEPETVIRILKLLPLLSGALQVEICYRALRYAYPQKGSQQVIGTLIGGLIPMNLYMSQSIGNEPLVGCLTALAILGTCRILSGDGPVEESSREAFLTMGFILGLALLTKPTPILIVPPLLFFVSMTLSERSGTQRKAIQSVSRFTILLLGTAFVIAGWYYLRNYFEIGQFFIGGWDASRKIVWWMDPGYRTPRQCYIFGEALFYPVFSAIFGFWDALYSTFWLDGNLSSLISGEHLPWNKSFMISSAWLSLLPTVAMIVGAAMAVLSREKGPRQRMLRFAFSCVLLYLAAIFYVFLIAPILTSAKASYALGLIPCFALLAARGFEVLTSHRVVKAVLYGIFACWAVAAYGAYFAI